MYHQQHQYPPQQQEPALSTGYSGLSVQELKAMTASRLAASNSTHGLPQIQNPRGLPGNPAPFLSQRSLSKSGSAKGFDGRSEALNIACLSVQDIKELTRQRLAREASEKKLDTTATSAPNGPVMIDTFSRRDSIEALPHSFYNVTPSSTTPQFPAPIQGSAPNRIRLDPAISPSLSSNTSIHSHQSSYPSSHPLSVAQQQLQQQQQQQQYPNSRPISRPETLSPKEPASIPFHPTPTRAGLSNPAGFTQHEVKLSRALTLVGDGDSGFNGLPQHHPISSSGKSPSLRAPPSHGSFSNIEEISLSPSVKPENRSRSRLLNSLPDVKQLFGFRDKTSSPILTASALTSLGNMNSTSNVPFSNAGWTHGTSTADAKDIGLYPSPLIRDDSSGISSTSGSSPDQRGYLPSLAKEMAEAVLDSMSYTPRSAASNFDDSNLSMSNLSMSTSKGIGRADSNKSLF